MNNPFSNEIILTKQEIEQIITDENNKIEDDSAQKPEKIVIDTEDKTNKTFETINNYPENNFIIDTSHKLKEIIEGIRILNLKVNNIEDLNINLFKKTINDINFIKLKAKYKKNYKENNFDKIHNKTENNNTKYDETKEDEENHKLTSPDSYLIKRKYFFVFKTVNKDKIGEVYDEIKMDSDFDNFIFLKNKKKDTYYTIFKFKARKTIDTRNLKDFQYFFIGKNTKNSLEELKEYCDVLCDIKKENIRKETKGADIINGIYKSDK